MNSLAQQARAGNRRALARLLTMVENQREGADEALADLFKHTGHAAIIGITGAPGTGKSTLASALAFAYRQQGHTVAVLAVDPTSPFTGGALLGDRIRMGALTGDSGVFIRSMATRGTPGGLARTTREVVWVLDAVGYDIVLIETVGAGQSEVDIARTAHTIVVVEAPGLGDGVQAMKAGIMEIADVLVVNKADQPGALNTVRSLKGHLSGGYHGHHHHVETDDTHLEALPNANDWQPPVIQTVALEQRGIDELIQAIDAHQGYRAQHHRAQEATTLRHLLLDDIQQALLDEFQQQVSPDTVNGLVEQLQNRDISPKQAVQHALAARSRKGFNT